MLQNVGAGHDVEGLLAVRHVLDLGKNHVGMLPTSDSQIIQGNIHAVKFSAASQSSLDSGEQAPQAHPDIKNSERFRAALQADGILLDKNRGGIFHHRPDLFVYPRVGLRA